MEFNCFNDILFVSLQRDNVMSWGQVSETPQKEELSERFNKNGEVEINNLKLYIYAWNNSLGYHHYHYRLVYHAVVVFPFSYFAVYIIYVCHKEIIKVPINMLRDSRHNDA